jgi:hypothetical protein
MRKKIHVKKIVVNKFFATHSFLLHLFTNKNKKIKISSFRI